MKSIIGKLSLRSLRPVIYVVALELVVELLSSKQFRIFLKKVRKKVRRDFEDILSSEQGIEDLDDEDFIERDQLEFDPDYDPELN